MTTLPSRTRARDVSAFVQEVPQHLVGRAFGIAVTLLMAVQGAVLLVAGALAEVTDPRTPVAALALCCLLVVPLLQARPPGASVAGRRAL